jgi:hypothetical protein
METYRVTVSEEYLSEFVIEASSKKEATELTTFWKESVTEFEMMGNGKLVKTEMVKQEVISVSEEGSPNEDR